MYLFGGGLILGGCIGLGIWYRQQFLERLRLLRELIRILEQWSSEIRFGQATLPECCRRVGRSADGALGAVFAEVYEAYQTEQGEGFLAVARRELGRRLLQFPLKKEDVEQFLLFTGQEGYRDREMQLTALELSRQGVERIAEVQQREIRQKCRLSLSLGTMSGLLLLLLLL